MDNVLVGDGVEVGLLVGNCVKADAGALVGETVKVLVAFVGLGVEVFLDEGDDDGIEDFGLLGLFLDTTLVHN